MKEKFIYTLELAKMRAAIQNLIPAMFGYNAEGRRVIWVPSTDEGKAGANYPVTHTPHGFECPCKSGKYRDMCVHHGSAANYVMSLSRAERTVFLQPNPAKGARLVKLAQERKLQLAKQAAAVKEAQAIMTNASQEIEARLAFAGLMR